MSWFKKPVKVKCYDTEALAKLLGWIRSHYGLAEISRTEFYVKTVMTSIFAEEQRVLYFEVDVPYYMFKPLREQLLEREVFDPILENRAITELLGS